MIVVMQRIWPYSKNRKEQEMLELIKFGITGILVRFIREEKADEVFGKAALIAIIAVALIAFMVLAAAIAGAFENATGWLGG